MTPNTVSTSDRDAPPTAAIVSVIFVFWSAILLWLNWGDIAEYRLRDADDFLRMTQVRDWMAGQSWFDVFQHRLNAPDGANMHWSRFVDVPIAAVIAVAEPILGGRDAELLAVITVPLFILALTLFFLYRAARPLMDWKGAAIAAALLPTCPLIVSQLRPMRIDHHNWQIAMAALALWAILDERLKYRAIIAGFALAMWMHISVEGLPYAVAFAAVFAAGYILNGEKQLTGYVGALTVFSVLLLLATRDGTQFAIRYCDAVSWPLLAALSIISLILAAGLWLVRSQHFAVRLGILALAAVAGGAVFLGSSDSCALDPIGGLEPAVQSYWYGQVLEGLDISRQSMALAIILLVIPALGLIGTIFAWRSARDSVIRQRWLTLGAILLASWLISLKVMRAGAIAELFALPGLAYLMLSLFRSITNWKSPALRVPAILAMFFVISPFGAMALGAAMTSKETSKENMEARSGTKDCNLDRLATLPPARIFTTIDITPEIIFKTRHEAYISGHHRNHEAMNRSIRAFTGKPETARRIIIDSKADYVVLCNNSGDTSLYISGEPHGFAAQLMDGKTPIWLEPMPDLAPDSKLWQVRK